MEYLRDARLAFGSLCLGYTDYMRGTFWTRFSPVLLWQYRRGAWQYDVIVALIVAFIFLSPRALFNDRPSGPVVREIEIGAAGPNARVFWIDPDGLEGIDLDSSDRQLQELVRDRTGADLSIIRTEMAEDEAGNVRGYLVYAVP